jgi:hypothetical protein
MNRVVAALAVAAALTVSAMGCVAVVRTGPPAPRVEVRPFAPYPEAVWIDGHWDYRRGNWVWMQGYWERRPFPGAVWTPGHWRETPGGWKWIPGHWRQ